MVAHNHKPAQCLLTIYQLQSCWLLLCVCVWFTQPSWRWRQYISPKGRYTHARLHGVTPHRHHRDTLRYRLTVFKWHKSTFCVQMNISRRLTRTQDSSLVACDAVLLSEWFLIFGRCVVPSSSRVGTCQIPGTPDPPQHHFANLKWRAMTHVPQAHKQNWGEATLSHYHRAVTLCLIWSLSNLTATCIQSR